MDMHLNLFFLEDCFKPSNGYTYHQNSLNSLLEHKTFSLKGRNEIQSVITFINTKLNSHSDRAQGLHLIKVFLPQCSDDVFIDNCVSWMQQCVRICSGSRENEIISLVYEVLGNLFQYSGMIQELTKPVSGSVIPKFLEHIHHVSSNFQSRTENAAHLLRCLEFVMRNYGGSCGPHKGTIEQFLMKFVDHPDKQTVHFVARCVAVLPLVGGGGVLNVNHKNSWEILQKKLLLYLQETLDAIFEGVPEVQLFQGTERIGTEKLHLPLLEESDPFLRTQRLAVRFINLSCFLQELLLHEFPVVKRVMPQLFINLFVRGFAVNSNTVSKHITADKMIVGCLIPQMHIAMFKLLGALIISCGQNLLEYGSLICRFVLQTLKWTSYDKHWPYGSERPYGQLRKEAYNTLILWLQVAKAGSCVEISSPDELIELLIGDVKISHSSVTLSTARARGRHLTKQQRKQLKLGQDSSVTTSELSWSRTKLYDETANHDTCTAALRTLQWIIQTAGPFVKPTLHKMLQEELLKILLKIGRGEIYAPYSDWKCRLELYQLLQALVMWPHCSWPPPLQFILQLMRVGLSDPCVKVASFCSQSLNSLVKLVHPVSKPLHFPPSGDDMQELIQLENSHRNKIFCSEDMDTNKPHISSEEEIGFLQASSSPKHVLNTSENLIHEKNTSNVEHNTEIKILETETMQEKIVHASGNNSAFLSNHIATCQDRSLNSNESSENAMDFEADNSTSIQQSQNIVTDKKFCEQNDTELENQNDDDIAHHPKLITSKDELQVKSVEIVVDSCISSSHTVDINETKEEDQTVESNYLPEKLEVTGAGGEEEAGDEEEKKEVENRGDRNETGYKTEEEADDDDDDDDDDDANDDEDDDSTINTKESYLRKQANLKNSDKTVAKPVTCKASALNNYSISYLYDQSSDSHDSDIETDIVTCSVPLESNEVGQEKLEEDNSLADVHTVKTRTHEHSQTDTENENYNENKDICIEIQEISPSQKLINDMCKEKQSGENLLDDTDNNADDSEHKVLPVNVCRAVDSEDSEVDVTTIPGILEETEKEVAENINKIEVPSALDEGTVEHKDINGEIQSEFYIRKEVVSPMEIEKMKETTAVPEEKGILIGIHGGNDEISVSEVEDAQCISGPIGDKFMEHSGNGKSELVDGTDTAEQDKEREFKTELSLECPRKEFQLQDIDQDPSSEKIIHTHTSLSPNGQDSMPQVQCHSVEKEINELCTNSVANGMITQAEKIDNGNLTEPLAKKRKLDSSLPETETEKTCQQQQKDDDI